MREPMNYCTLLRGEAARRFQEYLEAPTQEFSPEALAMFKRVNARIRAREEQRKAQNGA